LQESVHTYSKASRSTGRRGHTSFSTAAQVPVAFERVCVMVVCLGVGVVVHW
jgi:hypothetical protein